MLTFDLVSLVEEMFLSSLISILFSRSRSRRFSSNGVVGGESRLNSYPVSPKNLVIYQYVQLLMKKDQLWVNDADQHFARILRYRKFWNKNMFRDTPLSNCWMGTNSLSIRSPHFPDMLFGCFSNKSWWILCRLTNWDRPWTFGVLFQA